MKSRNKKQRVKPTRTRDVSSTNNRSVSVPITHLSTLSTQPQRSNIPTSIAARTVQHISNASKMSSSVSNRHQVSHHLASRNGHGMHAISHRKFSKMSEMDINSSEPLHSADDIQAKHRQSLFDHPQVALDELVSDFEDQDTIDANNKMKDARVTEQKILKQLQELDRMKLFETDIDVNIEDVGMLFACIYICIDMYIYANYNIYLHLIAPFITLYLIFHPFLLTHPFPLLLHSSSPSLTHYHPSLPHHHHPVTLS